MILQKEKSKTKILAYMGVMVALLAALSQIAFPLPFTTVPISLGLFGVLLAGVVLGPVYGTLSVGVYIVLGLIGAPVFAGFRGGFGVLAGSTGGYIIGYIFSAACAGICAHISITNIQALSHKNNAENSNTSNTEPKSSKQVTLAFFLNKCILFFGMTVAVLLCYCFGTVWFSLISGLTFSQSLATCVIPFIPGDIIKIVVAGILAPILSRVIR